MMKKIVLVAIAIVAAASLTVVAQSRRGERSTDERQAVRSERFVRPTDNLDEKQREEINKIRTEQLKERTRTNSLLREKRARLEELQTADKPDMNEINKVIDEITALQAQQMKSQAVGRQQTRSLLTNEQRTYYDRPVARRESMQSDRRVRPESERLREERPERQRRVRG